MTTFVYNGDPPFDSLNTASRARWTGSSGYGWNSGGVSELSYEAAMGSDSSAPSGKHLVLAFSREVPVPTLDSLEGMRIGFNYTAPKPHTTGTEVVSQIIVLNFATGNHAAGFSTTPPACTSASTTLCANDPSGNPDLFVAVKPGQVNFLQKIDDGTPSPWTVASTGDPYAWVKNNTRLWVFADNASGTTKYYWRLHVALPIRGGATPDRTANWDQPSIYLPDAVFSATSGSKTVPPFWVDMITNSTGVAGVTYKHFPDWVEDATAPLRDGTYQIPSTVGWGEGEMGSPRDPALLSPGDIQCAGTGLLIQASTGDNVVWHSDIWNTSAGNNTSGVFNDGGRLYMVDSSNHIKGNKLAVKVKNTGTKVVDRAAVKAHFLIAPYGSQAPQTIWSPLTQSGNDFTCSGSSTPNQASCTPTVNDPTMTFDSAPTTSGNLNQNDDVQINMATEWKPSADYVCAVQTTDTTPNNWYWNKPGFTGPGTLCDSVAWHPNSTDGSVAAATGLPGHQCLQVQLSSTTAGVQFATRSAFRNMHQATASMHRETAQIDTRGLKRQKPGQAYNEYLLYVETHNMPYRVDSGYSPPTYNQAMGTYNKLNRGCQEEYYLAGEGEGGCGIPGFDSSVPAPSENFFARTMPTIVIHTYLITGQKYKVNGETRPVLQEMTSFGQFISHDSAAEGPVFGWDASLEPVAGTTFQKVGVDTYKIRVPINGVGKVITHVEPLPSKRPVCGGTVNMDIVELLNEIAPLIKIDDECAGEINALINSLQIECVDLKWFLDKIASKDWGCWTSWVKFLADQVMTASGCKCN